MNFTDLQRIIFFKSAYFYFFINKEKQEIL